MDIYQLIQKAQTGDKETEKELIAQNMPLVYSCVRRFAGRGFELEDLVQLGSIGLLKAIRNFDVSYEVKFSTYAVPLILGEVKRFMRDDGTVKVSRGLKEIWAKAVRIREQLTKQNNREPTIHEIALETGIDSEKLLLAAEACLPCESLQKPIAGTDGKEMYLADTLADGDNENSRVDKIALKNALIHLEERDRKIVLLRYFRGKTQCEVSDIIGVSQVQISRIEKKILASLQVSLQ